MDTLAELLLLDANWRNPQLIGYTLFFIFIIFYFYINKTVNFGPVKCY